MLNRVMIIGRLGRDPELKYSSSGMPIANLRIATDESYVDRDGNKVERSYGDNYNLEAGAKVEALSSQPELDAQHKPQWILNNVSSQQTR